MNNPFVSIIVPCRNEEGFIARCLDSLISNDYPHDSMEMIVVDGMSADKTPEIVRDYHLRFGFIRLLQNPGKIFPSAVNIGVEKSRGEYIFIAGAHATYDPLYIKKCIENSIKYNAENSGGILITKEQEKSYSGEVITFVLSSSFGVGNSTFRTGSTEIREVDTVFGGCYRRDVFKKIGYFNEKLISTSDYEFNKRLRRSGGKIILDPGIKAEYYTRTTFFKFIRNNFRNGYWAIFPLFVVDYIPVSLRHFVPLAFVLSIIFSLFLSLFYYPLLYLFFLIAGLYIIISLAVTLRSAKKPLNIFIYPLFFFLLHFTYGLGSCWALIKIALIKLKLVKF